MEMRIEEIQRKKKKYKTNFCKELIIAIVCFAARTGLFQFMTKREGYAGVGYYTEDELPLLIAMTYGYSIISLCMIICIVYMIINAIRYCLALKEEAKLNNEDSNKE